MKKLEGEFGFKLLLIDAKAMLGKTREIMEEKKVTIPVLIDSRQYARNTLNVMYTPTMVILDGEGRVKSRMVGASPDLNEIVTEVLSKL